MLPSPLPNQTPCASLTASPRLGKKLPPFTSIGTIFFGAGIDTSVGPVESAGVCPNACTIGWSFQSNPTNENGDADTYHDARDPSDKLIRTNS
jgi:hypothetical protein